MKPIVPVIIVLLGLLFLAVAGFNNALKHRKEEVKACNRKGAIYSDGVCQHVFAPICRRL